MNHSTFGEMNSFEILLKVYLWLESIESQELIIKEDSNHIENLEESIQSVSNNASNPNLLNNNRFKPIPESPQYNYCTNFPTIPSSTELEDKKKRKYEESLSFVCHTIESMKEEEERKKTQPKRRRGRPRKYKY